MYTVYKLVWSPSGRYYYGYTSKSLEERIAEHRRDGTARVKQAFAEDGNPKPHTIETFRSEIAAERLEGSLIDEHIGRNLCLNERR